MLFDFHQTSPRSNIASISLHVDQAEIFKQADEVWVGCVSSGFRETNKLDYQRAFDGNRVSVRADEKLTAFLKLEAAI